MFTRLADSLAATEAVSEIFSDASVLQVMLDFEAALARAEAHRGVIPEGAAEAITQTARAADFDISELTRLAFRAGTPAIPLVKMLTERVRATHPDAAGFVHWGSTSQDVVDTALALLLSRCRAILHKDHGRITRALRRLSDEHAGTVMLSRTLLQPGPPTTFGLKAAGWYGAVSRGWDRVASRFEETELLQFGGASGTLAALGDDGFEIAQELSRQLELKLPDAPWHAWRDRLAALMAALSIYTASLGKIALDISLMMQFEVNEAAEPSGPERGGSSAMPNKRNPAACMLALAAAKRVPGLLADFIACTVQEHERALGGWQAEWPLIQGIIQSAAVALDSVAEVVEGLEVNVTRMRANIDATRGSVFAERAMMILARETGRDAARREVEEAIRTTGSPPAIPGLSIPENYLGTAEIFRRRLLDRGDK